MHALFELILLFLPLFIKHNFATLHMYRENINALTLNKQTKTDNKSQP